MDTTEELTGYFYAGRTNLKASELFFVILCEKFVEQFGLGIADFGAVFALLIGKNDQVTRAKPRDAIKGTSRASKAVRNYMNKSNLPKHFPGNIKLPTIIGGYTPRTIKIKYVSKISTFVGRTIPVVGWVILANDVSQITYKTTKKYNRVVRGKDKVW